MTAEEKLKAANVYCERHITALRERYRQADEKERKEINKEASIWQNVAMILK